MRILTRRLRTLTAVTMACSLSIGVAAPGAAADPASDVADVIVTETSVEAGKLSAGAPDSGLRARSATLLQLPSRAHVSDGSTAPAGVAQRDALGTGAPTASASVGFSSFSGGLVAGGSSLPAPATGAVVGSSVLIADDYWMTLYQASTMAWVRSWHVETFFQLAGNQYHWAGYVASSRYQGRFVAVMPSFDAGCGKGWLTVAVSVTASPAGTWRHFRIPMTDAWTDSVSIGVSDNKVVITANEWDLDAASEACLGSSYKGSRIRVMDWTDLVDGGTLTVRDVSSTPRTNYYSWVAASNVPGTTSTEAGNTVRLVGDKYVGGWGHVAFATVTGSAKSGTAKLAGLSDLTVSRSMSPLIPPPESIAAFPSGNGYQDERVLSAVVRGSRLWFSSNSACQDGPGPNVVACSRFTALDLSAAPPRIADDGYLFAPGTDTFHPIVGMTRGGSAFMTVTRAASVSPAAIELYATYRDPGAPLASGAREELILSDPHPYGSTAWPGTGSMVADPSQTDTAWAVIPVPCYDGTSACAGLLQLRSRLSDAPGGSVALGDYSNGWVHSTWPKANFAPVRTSPIKWVRVSTSPDTEDTAAGPLLVLGTTWASSAVEYPDLSSTASQGGTQGDTVEAWVQWGTGTAWSQPVAVSGTIDITAPVMTRYPVDFAKATVGKTVPIRMSWSATDPESGIAAYQVGWNCDAPDDYLAWLPPSATAHTRRIHFGTRCSQYYAAAYNGAGYAGGFSSPAAIKPKAVQGAASALSYSGAWSVTSRGDTLGGSTHYAVKKGASVTYAFTGRAVAFVTTLGPNRGRAEIWVDGVRVTTMDFKAASKKYRQLVWSTAWPTSGSHTVKIRVLGTPGRPRVDADAFIRI